jgi:dihydropteroate synthase
LESGPVESGPESGHESGRESFLACGRFCLSLDRPLVMGIVNVTPDSFSDGGRFLAPASAIAAARRLVGEGADIVDLGAESTRPGAAAVTEDQEWARIEPVLAGLTDLQCPVSVDTRHPSVMARAIGAGASIINDIEGFRSEAARAAVAGSDAGLVVMHMKGEPRSMQAAPHYGDVVAEVRDFLAEQRDRLHDAGVGDQRICLDPGFGFGKTLAHNLQLLAGLEALRPLGCPVLVGLSRKSMIGALTGLPVDERLGGSIAAALAAVERGAQIVRVHDVAQTVAALAVWKAVRGAARQQGK